jgi:hypothetical protein
MFRDPKRLAKEEDCTRRCPSGTMELSSCIDREASRDVIGVFGTYRSPLPGESGTCLRSVYSVASLASSPISGFGIHQRTEARSVRGYWCQEGWCVVVVCGGGALQARHKLTVKMQLVELPGWRQNAHASIETSTSHVVKHASSFMKRRHFLPFHTAISVYI